MRTRRTAPPSTDPLRAVAPHPVDDSRRDVLAAGWAFGLVAVAAVVGAVLYVLGRPVRAGAAPLFADWVPHVGPGTPAALIVAALVVRHGPDLAARWGFGRLLAGGYAAAVAWTLSLALVDGWQRGVAGRLTTEHEYLSEVGGVTDVPAMLAGFAGRILDLQPDSWTTHVAGHPPGALLVFVALDRVGLGGGAWAGLLCVLVGATVSVSVPVTLRACGDEAAARAAVPFLVLLPGAVWVGVSADGLFAGVTAAGVALLAVGLSRPAPWAAGLAGVLLAYGVYLSYGLLLMAPVVLAVVVVCRRAWPLLIVAAGGATVVAGFTAAGFWWPDGYHLVVERYYQGIASRRPYAYWVWADLAAAVVCAGPAAAAVLRRAVGVLGPAVLSGARPVVRGLRRGRWCRPGAVAVSARVAFPVAAVMAVLAADVSGLSKAEVERIWLPFLVWLPAGAVLLPPGGRRGWLLPPGGRRGWLLAQATTALLVNHLLLTTW